MPNMEMQGKVDPGDHHKERTDGHNRRAIKEANTGIVGREATNGDGGKTMAYGVEAGHARQPIGESTDGSQGQVNLKQHIGRLTDPRGQFGVLHWSRCLCAIELHTTDPEHWQNGHRDHHYTYTAEPLQLLAIVENRFR